MSVLVTGGAGFIGSHIVRSLLKNGHAVRVLDNLSTGQQQNIIEFQNNSNFEFVLGDICDINVLRNAMNGINIVCHQAALASVSESIENPIAFHKCNVTGFLNLLSVAKEKGIQRIVYATTSAVYGDDPLLPKIEQSIGKSLSPYATTKYLNELYAKLFTDLYGLECIGLRYFNVFGPNQSPYGAYAAVIPKFISCLKSNKNPTIYGDGSYSRDFTYIDDVVQANYLALTTKNKDCFGEVFNIGSGVKFTILEMFYVIKNQLGVDLDPIFQPERPGDIPHSVADISKAQRLLNYKPRVTFIDGIAKTLNFYHL